MSVFDINPINFNSFPNQFPKKDIELPEKLDERLQNFVLPLVKGQNPSQDEIIESLMHVSDEGIYPVTIKRPIGDFVCLSDDIPEEFGFDRISDTVTRIRFEGVELEKSVFNDNTVSAFCKFSKDPPSKAVFQWDHDASSREVTFQEAYNGRLPRWVKMGDPSNWLHPNKGVPTAKLMKLMMMHKLGLNKENVNRAVSCAMNAQTVVDILHDMIIKRKGLQEAVSNSQTVQMLSELGEMLGYKNTWLTSVKADFPEAYTYISTLLKNTGWNEERIKVFGEQRKVRELENAGFPIMDANFKVPDALNIEVQFSDR